MKIELTFGDKKIETTTEELKEVAKAVKHEHRYYPNSRQKSETCIICGYTPPEITLTRNKENI